MRTGEGLAGVVRGRGRVAHRGRAGLDGVLPSRRGAPDPSWRWRRSASGVHPHRSGSSGRGRCRASCPARAAPTSSSRARPGACPGPAATGRPAAATSGSRTRPDGHPDRRLQLRGLPAAARPGATRLTTAAATASAAAGTTALASSRLENTAELLQERRELRERRHMNFPGHPGQHRRPMGPSMGGQSTWRASEWRRMRLRTARESCR